jgi:hypothetical protein
MENDNNLNHKNTYNEIKSTSENQIDEVNILEAEENCSIQDIINYSKGNQKFQKRMFIGFCLAQIMLGMVTVSLIFFFYSVNFTCNDEAKSNFNKKITTRCL